MNISLCTLLFGPGQVTLRWVQAFHSCAAPDIVHVFTLAPTHTHTRTYLYTHTCNYPA